MTKNLVDEVGYWTEIKLSILKEYASAYTTIMHKQRFKEVAYIDGFAGCGEHLSRETGERIDGSPLIALGLPQPFTQYHFIDLDGKKAAYLNSLAAGNPSVSVWEGDCNRILLDEIFPRYTYESYRKALCLLDPYNLNPNWEVVRKAGELRSIEIFLNFMIMDANQNILFTNPDKASPDQQERMNTFWGDSSWETIAYRDEGPDLFGKTILNKAPNEIIIKAYRERLKKVAGFSYVPDPMPLRNSRGAIIYYLFFASHNATGSKIIEYIMNKYKAYGV